MMRRFASVSAAAGRRFASTLVVAEHAGGSIVNGTLSAVTAAKAIGGSVDLLVTGTDVSAAAAAAAAIEGVDKVLTAVTPQDGGVAEDVTEAVLAVQGANSYSHILVSASNFGKNFAPRAAAKLDVAAIADVTAVVDEDTFQRPIYAGNALATVKSKDSVKIMTVRGASFEKAAAEGGSAAVEEAPAAASAASAAKFVSEELVQSDRPSLDAARVVISGGRGLKNGENFEILYKLADSVGGAVGASRAAVDAGWVPADLQVGQTGKVVAPDLYVAFGISGAIQHVAGMKDSKVIVAVNKDEEAPIFQVADYGLVGDLFDVAPALTDKVAADN